MGLILGIALAEVYVTISPPLILTEGTVTAINDRDYFPAVNSLISQSKQSIHAVIFSFQHYTNPQYRDSEVNTLIAGLLSAKSRGVEVKVIIDDWPEGNEDAAKYLKERGVDIRVLHDDSLTTHNKFLIFDGSIIVVGSSNWSHFSIEQNHESNVLISSSELSSDFEEYFETLWIEASFP